MLTVLIIFIPLIALFVWAVVFDVRQRRRRGVRGARDIGAAVRRTRAGVDARDTTPPDSRGGGWGP